MVRTKQKLNFECYINLNHSHSQGGISSLTLAEPPEGLPQGFHQGKLQVDHHIQYGLTEHRKQITSGPTGLTKK